MVVVTGGAGFIGSAVVWRLNAAGVTDIVVADRLGTTVQWRNLLDRRIADYLDKDELLSWLQSSQGKVEQVIHMGACTDTTETDVDYLMRNNYGYSQHLWRWCTEAQVPFIYASSAATYGSGEHGYVEDDERVPQLQPLNAYGFSKNAFDAWALAQTTHPPVWAGLKFFNVFGPNEYHKDGMASVALHLHRQIRQGGTCRLFRSYRSECADGEQRRDFVYIKDVVEVIEFVRKQARPCGLLNVGTGHARSFNDLATAVCDATNRAVKIEYIDMPEAIRDKYQYFTQAAIGKLRRLQYDRSFMTLEAAVHDYVTGYLDKGYQRL